MEALRRNLRKVEEELAQVRKQLDDKTRALQELRRALPPIPNPEHLYRNIIDRCHQFYACTTSTTELSNRIKALYRSVDSYENRLHETSLLELSVDKVRVEILFIRFQLRTFFSAPALLCAFGLTTMEVWQAWMDRPQENEAGAPLLSRPEDIERVADDQLHQLDCHRRALTEIRASLMHEERQTNLNFQFDMRRAVAELQSSLNVALQSMEQRAATAPIVDAHNDSAMEDAHEEEAPPDGDQDSSGKAPAPEDIAMQEQEREALQQNVEFLEEVEDLEEVEVVEGEAEEEEEDPQEDMQERLRRENESMRRQIETEIQQLEQSCTDFRAIIEELRDQPTCPRRRFARGAIRREDERTMQCVFCAAVGQHYSDSCTKISSVFVRRRMTEVKGRCEECLETCMRGEDCPKHYTRCYYCREFGHHSALCYLPEQSEQRAERLARARHSLSEATERIGRLRRDLRFFRD